MPQVNVQEIRKTPRYIIRDANTNDVIKFVVPSDLQIGVSDINVSSTGIILPSKSAPTATTNKLYNENGTLKFNGSTIGGGITGVTAGTGMSGGGTSGTVTLNLDANALSALGTTAETSDYVVIEDATDNSTKKLLISNLPGDIQGVTAGTGLSGGGTSGTVTLALDVSELSALGASAENSDYVVIEDVTDNSTKKVLVSNLPSGGGGAGGWTDDGSIVRLTTSTDKVGIGQSTPPKTLTLEFDSSDTTVATGNTLTGGGVGSGFLIENINTTANTYANLDFRAATNDARIALTYNGSSNTGDFHFITDGGSLATAVVITGDKKVGIGTTSPTYMLDVDTDTALAAQVGITQYNNSTATDGANLRIRRARGTQASPAIVSDGDLIGSISFYGHDGTDFEDAASIWANVDGTPGDDTTDMPGRLTFLTTPDGSDQLTERMRIDSAGNVGIGVTDPDTPLEVLSTSAQQKWSYDSDSYATLAVGASSATTLAIGESGNLTIDVGGDIILDAAGETIYFKDAGTERIKFNLDNSPQIDVTGDFTIDGSADIILDAAGGNLLLKNNTATYFDINLDSTPEIDVTGDFRIDGSGTITLDATGDIIFQDAGSEVVRIEDGGQVGIGTSTPQAELHVNRSVGPAGIVLSREDGLIATNEGLGALYFGGSEDSGSTFDYGAEISARAASAWTVGSDIPTYLMFKTVPDGSSTLTERMRITAEGLVGIGVADPDAQLEVLYAGTQLKLSYDGTYYSTFAVGSAGDLTVNASGGDILLDDNVDVGGGLDVTGGTATFQGGQGIEVNNYVKSYGDTDTYINFTTADKMGFQVGSLNFANFHETTQDIIDFNPGESDIDFNVRANSANNALFVEGSSGNVGIGAAAPPKDLTIEFTNTNTVVADGHGLSGGAVGDGVLIENTSTATNTYANLDFRAATTDARIALTYNGSTNAGDLHFVTDGGTLATAMVITGDKKVGIGVTDPTLKLHVNRSAGTPEMGLTREDSAITAGEGLGTFYFGGSEDSGSTFDYGATIQAFAEGAWTVGSDIPTYLVFSTVPDGTSTLAERMRISSDGSVGIGVTDPDAPLELRAGDGVTQLKLSYNNTYSCGFALNTVGNLTLTPGAGGGVYPTVTIAGDLDLTGGLDVADGKDIITDKVRARDGDGLYLLDDGSAGIFIADGGRISMGGGAGSGTQQDGYVDIYYSNLGPKPDIGDAGRYQLSLRGLPDGASATSSSGVSFSTHSTQVGAAIIFEDTGDYSQGELSFYTKESEVEDVDPVQRMVIKEDGRIGIGRSPLGNAAQLEVEHDTRTQLRLLNTIAKWTKFTVDSNGDLTIGSNNATAVVTTGEINVDTINVDTIMADNSTSLRLGNDEFVRLSIMDAGNIAIGFGNGGSAAAEAEAIVHISQYPSINGPHLNLGDPGRYQFAITGDYDNGDMAGICLGAGASGGVVNNVGAAILFEQTGAESKGNLNFYTKADTVEASAPILRMTLLDGGNVGINCSDPGSLLEVRGDAGTGAASAGILRLSTAETTVVDGDYLGKLDFIAPKEASDTDAILVGASIWAEANDTFAADNNTTDLVFATATTAAATEVVRITSAGNVGIGQSAPPKTLTLEFDSTSANAQTGNGISGGGAGYGLLIENTNSTANTYANLDFRSNNADGRIALVYTDSNDGDFYFITDNNGSMQTSMVITSTGNVGIGTTAPQHPLDVYEMGGLYLGYTMLDNDGGPTSYSYTCTTTYTVPTANWKITFTAPASGKVEIGFSCFLKAISPGASTVYCGLSTSSTYASGDISGTEKIVAQPDESDDSIVRMSWYRSGLTPGTSYTYYVGTKADATASNYMWRYGGTNSGYYSVLTIKAIAIPNTVHTDAS